VEEDTREDAQQAIEETERARYFIPKPLLEVAPTRPRPLLVLVSRDVSASSKASILSFLTAELPGMFVAVDSTINEGLDVKAAQRALSAGQSVVMSVDVGLSAKQRGAFVGAAEISRRALVPSPCVILVLGDVRNRAGFTKKKKPACVGFLTPIHPLPQSIAYL